VLRLLAYQAFNGNEGILGPDDLKVTAQDVPTSSVKVAVGACAIRIKNAALTYQAYAGRMPTIDTPINIAATGGSVRSDMIIARVEDPNNAGEGWAVPGDRTVGPYIFTRVISGVPGTAKTLADAGIPTHNAIPLARIDIPVSTSTITNAMIVDLRKIANPRRERRVFTVNPGGTVNLTSASFVDFYGSWTVDVPAWATSAIMLASLGGVRCDRFDGSTNGSANGQLRLLLGASLASQGVGYNVDVPPSFTSWRGMLGVGDTVAVGSSLRGTNQTVKIQGKKDSGNKNIYADTSSFASVDLEFIEAAA
jgi:hypothetical protein